MKIKRLIFSLFFATSLMACDEGNSFRDEDFHQQLAAKDAFIAEQEKRFNLALEESEKDFRVRLNLKERQMKQKDREVEALESFFIRRVT